MTSLDPYSIEIELRAPLPRRVRYTRSTELIRRVSWNVLLVGYGLSCGLHFVHSFVVFAICLVLILTGSEWVWRRNFRLLRDGVAVVGKIVDCREVAAEWHCGIDMGTSYRLVFDYPLSNGEYWQREVPIQKIEYALLKDKTELTVLRSPSAPRSRSVPFFMVSEVEIEGAPKRLANGSVYTEV